jgi:excisionase family DNA binding protein
MAEHEPWATKGEIADHCRVSERTIERWLAQGLPSRKWGGARRFRLSEVEAWLEERHPRENGEPQAVAP